MQRRKSRTPSHHKVNRKTVTARIHNIALSALLVSGSFTASANDADTTGAAIDRWVALCNAQPSVTDRVGTVEPKDILDGLVALQQVGHSGHLSQMYQDEACLSMVVSHVMKVATLVMVRHPDPSDKARSASAVAAMHNHYSRVHTSRRLARMGISLAPDHAELKQARRLDPELAIETANLGILIQAGEVSRSYAVQSDSVCVIALEPSPMLDHLSLTSPWVYRHLPSETTDYLTRNGAALEMWHEAAHCNHEFAADTLETTVPQFRGDGTLSAAEPAHCSPSDLSKTPTHNRRETSDASLSLAKQSTSLTQIMRSEAAEADQQAIFNESVNRGIRLSLMHEALADQFAMSMLYSRGLQAQTCANEDQAPHPWTTLRLLWSIENPDARYMTWLMPWLEGVSQDIQLQVILEAFRGAVGAAKQSLPPAAYRELIQRRGRPEFLSIHDPQGDPDDSRTQAWTRWLLTEAEEIQRSSKVMPRWGS